MAEKPILFSGAMVRAVIKGSKTQTRRVVKPNPDIIGYWKEWTPERTDQWIRMCPYGKPGDRLWVRETFLLKNAGKSAVYRAAIEQAHGIPEAAGFGAMYGGWKPSIHMPRWASRLTLEITQVRVERVKDISRDDEIAEGMTCDQFPDLWEQINGKRGFGWEKNPWVWAISFRKVEAHAH